MTCTKAQQLQQAQHLIAQATLIKGALLGNVELETDNLDRAAQARYLVHILKRFDTDKSGELDLDEFTQAMSIFAIHDAEKV